MSTAHVQVRDEIVALMSELESLHALVEREAGTAERLNRPTPAVQRALKDTGVFRLGLDADRGGLQARPTEILEVIERVSHLDPSLGWLVRVIASETANVSSRLAAAALDELCDGEELLVTGQATAVGGTAVRDGDGWRFSGSWRYTPGLAMATHVVLCVRVAETGDLLAGVVGRDRLRIQDNWDMLGLRASASFDYDAEDVFVSDRFTFDPVAAVEGGHGLSDLLAPALTSALHQGAWAQGVGRRLLNELRAVTLVRLESGDEHLVSDEFYAEYARHHSHVRGTMALLRETWGGNEDTLRMRGALDQDQETMARLAASLSTRTVLEISQLVHRFAGAHVMRNGTLQRLFRDAHAGTQHRVTAHFVAQECGRMLLGALPAGAKWGQFDLVIPGQVATKEDA